MEEEQRVEAMWKWHRDRFDPPRQSASSFTVFPDESAPRPVLYGPKGEPLYRPKPKFGYRIEDPRC